MDDRAVGWLPFENGEADVASCVGPIQAVTSSAISIQCIHHVISVADIDGGRLYVHAHVNCHGLARFAHGCGGLHLITCRR